MSPAAEAEMVWLKSTLTGLVAAIVTVVAIVVATTSWSMSVGQGSGGIGVVSFGLSELLLFPAALAFAPSEHLRARIVHG